MKINGYFYGCKFGLVFGAVLLAASAAKGDVVYTASVNGGYDNVTLPAVSNTGTSTVTAQSGSALPIVPGISLFGQSIAGPNELGVEADTDVSGVGPLLTEASILSFARFNDTLLLSQNSPMTGILAIYEQIVGVGIATGTTGDSPNIDVNLSASTSGGGGCLSLSTSPEPPNCGHLVDGSNVIFLPYSEPDQYQKDLPFGEVFEGDALCDAQLLAGACIADAKFYDTAQITSIVVEDANGNVVPGASVVSENGVDYNAPIAPEPADLGLTILGSLIVSGLLVRRKIALL